MAYFLLFLKLLWDHKWYLVGTLYWLFIFIALYILQYNCTEYETIKESKGFLFISLEF